jgi:AcrR family transcriptional regulator
MDKKTVQDSKLTIKQDEKEKIISIQDAARILIEAKGYENVTIQDIAESACVNIDIIYKYFPGGKFDILKGIGYRYMDKLLMIKQPETVDFNNFPGYMRDIIKNMQQIYKDNSSLIKGLTMAALVDGEIVDEVKKMDIKDYKAISEFFARFNGVNIGNKDPLELLMYWGITVKGIILFNMIYPVPLKNEEVLTDLMVDLSLRIWDYHKTP